MQSLLDAKHKRSGLRAVKDAKKSFVASYSY